VETLSDQKQKRKCYASGQDTRRHYHNSHPLSEQSAQIENHKQAGYADYDKVIGTDHKYTIVTVMERKSGYAVIANVENKTADMAGREVATKTSTGYCVNSSLRSGRWDQ